jgi:undecaprenyl-diphosphatase
MPQGSLPVSKQSSQVIPLRAGQNFVINSAAGISFLSEENKIKKLFPQAKIFTYEEGDFLAFVKKHSRYQQAVAVAGGDGTANAGAHVALEKNKPLLLLPTGTLNHFARDLGANSLESVLEGAKKGTLANVDVGIVNHDNIFLNTASLGAYTKLISKREKIEKKKIGKWPSALIATALTIKDYTPIEISIAGKKRNVWLVFIGNCKYSPSGTSAAWRMRLDDGMFDVRFIESPKYLPRLKLILAALIGRL